MPDKPYIMSPPPPGPSARSPLLRRRFWVWGLCLLIISALFGWQVWRGLRVDANVLSLLPPTEQDPVVEDALKRVAEHLGQKTVFLFGAKSLPQAKRAADTYLAVLRSAGQYSHITQRIPQGQQRAFFQFYLPYRMQLLSPLLLQQLKNPASARHHLQKVLHMLHGPMSGSVSGLLAQDPLLLLPAYLRELPAAPGHLRLEGDAMVARAAGKVFVFAAATAKDSAFSRAAQKAQAALFINANRAMRRAVPQAQLLTTGAIYFAQAGGTAAEREISTIGLGSMLGVFLLLLLIFRSPRQLLLASLPLGFGFVAAWSTCIAFFGTIHMLTLVFGASLIGVSIDYAFHYFCEQRLAVPGWTPEDGLRHILPGVTIGAITSIIGYLGLGLAPFPGLRQMATFSAVGLLVAYATVVCWFPLLGGQWRLRPTPWLVTPASRLVTFWQGMGRRSPGKVVLLLLLLFSIAGLFQLRTNDDVRLLLHAPPALVKMDREVKGLLGSFDSNRLFLVEGKTPEKVLRRVERLSERLGQMTEKKQLGFFQSLAPFVPSQRRQQANKRQLRKLFGGPKGTLSRHMASLGFAEDAQRAVLAALGSKSRPGLTPAKWKQHPVSRPLRHLWLGRTSRGHASIILLGGKVDEAAMQALETPTSGIHYINKVDDISSLMRRYRKMASVLVGLAYLLIGLLVVWRYGLAHGFLVLVPPLLAAITALGVVGWAGQPLQLFHVLALLLVLGIGIDYTIFFAEATSQWQGTLLAIILSALTTLLSFGLLALSQTPLLRAFGMTILCGIAVALLVSPLALPTQKTPPTAQKVL